MDRRDFLKKSTLATSTLWIPGFLHGRHLPVIHPDNRRILIVVQLSGGNDGLNTVVPHGDDIYYKKRPGLAIASKEVLKLNEHLGLNPTMEGLRRIFDDGCLNIINSVGYPNPNRSHFRSMDIWQSGSPSDKYWTSGWLGRYLDTIPAGEGEPHQAIEMDDMLSLAMKGNRQSGFAIGNPDRLKNASNNPFHKFLLHEDMKGENHSLHYMYKTLAATHQSADYLYEKSRIYAVKETFPKHKFGQDLKQVTELIISGCSSNIYYLSLGSFDTHANQKGKHAKLLEIYSNSMQALVSELKRNNLLGQTLILTFSEFGRRVKENGSRGTDHGAGNNLFLIGGNLKKPGIFNDAPSLKELDNGDVAYQLDFRQIYATILEKWLGVNHTEILGANFQALDLI